MTRLDATCLSEAELAPMVRAWARSLLTSEAAVELLIAHDVWPCRADFRAALVDAVDDGWGAGGVLEPLAAVDWDCIEDYLDTANCTRSEAAMLRLAASLAGAAVSTSLAEMTSGVDDSNAVLVMGALARHFGRRH